MSEDSKSRGKRKAATDGESGAAPEEPDKRARGDEDGIPSGPAAPLPPLPHGAPPPLPPGAPPPIGMAPTYGAAAPPPLPAGVAPIPLAPGGGGGGVGGLGPGLGLGMYGVQDKINRELFVGNTPPGTSDALLVQFLTGAMRRTGLCRPDESPIATVRTNVKFAFVELATPDLASAALNLNGIPFMGAQLKVSRPSKYAGPIVAVGTWQQLTGQPLPAGVAPMSGGGGGSGGSSALSPEDKLNRELFVGNTTPEMAAQSLTDFLGKAMEQVGLSRAPGNPVVTCRTSGKFAFIELRTTEEAAQALNLNNIPYLGTNLKIGRPSKYTGPDSPHGNWEDILARVMSGELQVPGAGGGGGAAPAQAQAQAPADAAPPTRVVELKQMLTEDDLRSDEEYQDILEDTKEECSAFGELKSVVIPRSGPGVTKVFLEYGNPADAARAVGMLAGRTFDGRRVAAAYFDEDRFARKDYAD